MTDKPMASRRPGSHFEGCPATWKPWIGVCECELDIDALREILRYARKWRRKSDSEYSAEVSRLQGVIDEIARQPIGSEIKLPEIADFEDAYLICVQTARAAAPGRTEEMTDIRKTIAMAMGWIQSETGWRRPNGDGTWQPTDESCPNPENNANDCEELIGWLMARGWYVEIGFQSYPEADRVEKYAEGFGVFLHIWHVETEQHERMDSSFDSWKQGLCILAHTVIRQQEKQG